MLAQRPTVKLFRLIDKRGARNEDDDLKDEYVADRQTVAHNASARSWSFPSRRASVFSALMACLALHDKTASDKEFRPFLPLIEKGARDERNFVTKGVSWALRAIGKRSPALNASAQAVARRLAQSTTPSSRWVGKDALREFAKRARA